MKRWAKEENDYLMEIYHEKHNGEIANIMNNHFKGKYRTYTAISISTAKNRLQIYSKPKYGRLYTKEIIEFIESNYKGKDNIELAELLNETFGLNTNADKISMVKANMKRRYGIDTRTGINKGCYKKGHMPVNKGTKGMFNVGGNKGSFKKGDIPINHKEVGSERINADGYVEIKVAEPNIWEHKQRVVYREHYGEIPKGYKIIFADGNKQNLDLDNLLLVSNKEELIMNRNKLIAKDKEITKSGHLIAKVMDKVYEKSKK